jgi:hypothetical protein
MPGKHLPPELGQTLLEQVLRVSVHRAVVLPVLRVLPNYLSPKLKKHLPETE